MKSATTLVAVRLLCAGMILGGMTFGASAARAAEATSQESARAKLRELGKQDRFSPLLREVAKAIRPAVVEVRVVKGVRQRDTGEMDDLLRRFFEDETPNRRTPPDAPRRKAPLPRRPQFSLGSGVIVDAAKGYILTNWHVVVAADKVEVIQADGTKLDVEWVRSDQATDLAVVKVKPGNLADAPLGDSDALEVGDWVLAIGTPENLPQTVTAGIISAKGRSTGRGGYEDYLQTDAAINMGNSGGPLVNLQGEVIGINCLIITQTGGNEGIGFAIPSNMAKTVMAQLIENGKVVRGYVGVTIQDVNDQLAKSLGLPITRGALVTDVMKDSPAERAKIEVEDFIVAIDGKPVASSNDLHNRVATIAPGIVIGVELYRKGERKTVKVTLEARPAELTVGGPQTQPEKTPASQYGLEVATLTKELAAELGLDASAKGAVITRVDAQSDAASQGLRSGLLIVQVQDKPVATAEDFAKALTAKDAVSGIRLLVRDPKGGQRFVFITPQTDEK